MIIAKRPRRYDAKCVLRLLMNKASMHQVSPSHMRQDGDKEQSNKPCWAEAPIKIARMTLTIKLDGNWSSFQLANSAPPLSVTDSAIAPSARMPTYALGSMAFQALLRKGSFQLEVVHCWRNCNLYLCHSLNLSLPVKWSACPHKNTRKPHTNTTH